MEDTSIMEGKVRERVDDGRPCFFDMPTRDGIWRYEEQVEMLNQGVQGLACCAVLSSLC